MKRLGVSDILCQKIDIFPSTIPLSIKISMRVFDKIDLI